MKYDRQLIETNPNEFNDSIISALRKNYAEDVDSILSKFCSDVTDNIADQYRSKLERHLFPALVVSDFLRSNKREIESLCVSFIKGFSIPVLVLDKWLDSSCKIEQTELVQVVKLIYGSNMTLCGEHTRIARCFNNNYFILMESIEQEFKKKFLFPEKHAVQYYVSDILEKQRYYRSRCHYFKAIVEGTLELGRISINSRLEKLLIYYGILRQITDELADVEEDLKNGVLTLPILYTLEARDIQKEIEYYWESKSTFPKIKEYIIEAKGFYETFQLGMSIYKECQRLKEVLATDHSFIDDLFIFYDLKLCLLYRLRNNHWVDDRKTY